MVLRSFYIFSSVVLWFGILCQVDCLTPVAEVESICSSKSKPFGFTSPRQVKDLIDSFKAEPGKCASQYHGSFEALERVLDMEVLNDVCGPVAYERIREFHSRFISNYLPESTKEQLELAKQKGAASLEPIPSSLRRFFILFATQINAQCKSNLVEQLNAKRIAREEDFEMMKQMKAESSRLIGYEYKEQAKKLDDLVILNVETNKDAKLYVQVEFNDVIKKAKDACEAKFRPIYLELYVPVIRLNNLGYKARVSGEKAHEDLEKLDLDEKFRRWFSIIETCEILKDIEVIQDTSSLSAVADVIAASSLLYAAAAPTTTKNKKNKNKDQKDPTKANGPQRNGVTFLSEQEAEEVKQRIAKNIESYQSASVYEPRPVNFEHQQLVFTPRMWLKEDSERDDELYYYEKRMKKLISRKTSFFHLQRKAFSLMLKQKFHRSRLEIKNKDEDTALGRIAAFMSAHQVGIRLAMSIIGLIVVVLVHFG